MQNIDLTKRRVRVGARWLLGGAKVNRTSRGTEGRFQGVLSRMAATFFVFSNMIEAEEHFGLLVPPDRSVTANSLVSLLVRETCRKTLFPGAAAVT